MKKAESTKPEGLFVDIGQSTLQAVCGGDAFNFPLERTENGRLTEPCREKLSASLRAFLAQHSRATGRPAYCAIGARGVSIRRMSLPASSEDELRRVLRLQIENEFPLSPDELAWGSRPIGSSKAPGNGGAARRDLLVVAVKKELLDDYAAILAACGVAPRFTLAALAREELYTVPAGKCAVLDIGRTHSELMLCEGGVPTSIRLLAWGGDSPSGALADFVAPASLGVKLYLTGKYARDARMASLLTNALGGAVLCESLEGATGEETSSAITGLIKATGPNSASPPLILEQNGGQGALRAPRPTVWKWAAAAAALALAAFLFPYAEAIVFKPFLEKKLAGLQADRGRLATIDEELDFMKFLKQNQPPYLDTIYLLAKSAPQGMRLETLSLGRHQEVSLRVKFGNAQQVSEFRSKLIDSGWFANVMVEEQTPSPDRRVNVRMTAELKPAEARKLLADEPPSTRPHLRGDEPQFNMPPPEPMIMPAPRPAAMPAQMAPPPSPGGPVMPAFPNGVRRVRRAPPPDNP